jgi:hypothetical protein
MTSFLKETKNRWDNILRDLEQSKEMEEENKIKSTALHSEDEFNVVMTQ